MSSQGDLIRAIIAKRPVILTASLYDVGVTRSALAEATRRGDIVRYAPSVVISKEAEKHGQLDDAVACLSTGGIICHGTAGFRHGLSDEVANVIDLLVPHNEKRHPPSRQAVRFVRSRIPESFTVGIEEHQVLGVTVRMTDRARTVVDLVRGPVPQHGLAAVHTFLAEGGSGQDLQEAAEPFGAWDRLGPLVEATLQAMSRTLGPR